MTGKGVVRSIKNYAKGFSDVQRKVREATSNDAWGPSGTLMNEIAQCTFNQHDFIEVMDMIDKRLNDKGKNWRHVFKALLLLDYCLHVGSENVVLYAKENIYVIKTLKEFQHVDDSGRDVGANVRQKAKDITNLLTDDARLKDERRQRQQMRDRMAGVNDYMSDAMGIRSNAPSDFGGSSGPGQFNGGGRGGGAPGGGRGGDSEDRELQRALEESRRMAEAEERKRLENQGDEDLAKAIQLSEQEAKDKERKQREKLERENQDKLFGNSTNNNAQSTSFNPFPQNQSFDSSLNPYQQQQQQQWPQNTGMTNMTFSDPIGAAGNPQLSFQNTGMVSNPYQQQQQQQLQPQQSNPYQQFSGFGGSLQAQMTGLPQQATGLAPFQTSTVTGFQQPQLTAASNNPFGQFGATSQQTSSATFGTGSFAQTLSASPTFTSTSLANRSPSLSVANVSSSAAGQSRSFTFPSSPSLQPTGTQASSSPLGDGRHAKLNALLANKEDGMDTFGNTGNLRFPTGSGFANSIKIDFTGATNGMSTSSSSTGDLLGLRNNGNESNDTSTQTSFADSFGQQTSRNPFGQPSPSLTAASTPKSNNQKSLLELMQEQKQQQQQQQSLQIPQMGMQAQMTGMQQPMMQSQVTGMQPQLTGMAFGGQQPQQSSPFLQQPQVTGFNNNAFGQQQPQNQQTGSLF